MFLLTKAVPFGVARGPFRMSLCLSVSLWLLHIPVPVVHQHVGDLDHAPRIDMLSRHLGHFHSHDVHHEWFPWHIHWVQTADLADGELPDGKSDDQQLANSDVVLPGPFASPVVFPVTDQFASDYASAVAMPSYLCVEPTPIGIIMPHHFLQTYSPALPVRALLGAALC